MTLDEWFADPTNCEKASRLLNDPVMKVMLDLAEGMQPPLAPLGAHPTAVHVSYGALTAHLSWRHKLRSLTIPPITGKEIEPTFDPSNNQSS